MKFSVYQAPIRNNFCPLTVRGSQQQIDDTFYTDRPIRMFMQKEWSHAKRSGMQSGKDHIHRISLSQLVYRKLEDVKLITQEQYDALLKQYPELAVLYGILRDFHRIVFFKKAEELEKMDRTCILCGCNS